MSEHVNFHSLAVEPKKCHTRSFKHPRLGGREFVLTLETPDALTDYEAAGISAQLIRRYVTGDEALQMPAQAFFVGDEEKPLTERLCDDAALIVALQPQPREYQPEEILQMAFKLRAVWIEVRRWAVQLALEAEIALPNDSGAQEAGSCAQLSNADISTPASSTMSPGRSGASTSALAEVTG